tara:strand:- start:2403 stop:4208 length:1806 start_codon:yes stop_codon:yes gene_type:complete
MMTRPVLGGLFTYWDADNEALISAIIIDDSFSMSGKNDDLDRRDLLLSTFDSILKNVSDNSHIYIATLSKGKLYDGIKSKMPEINKLFHITYTSPEIGTIIQEMKSELSSQNAIKELYYITDGQESHLMSALPFKEFLSDWKIFTLIVPPIKENLAISDVDIKNAILLPNSPITISVTIVNNGLIDIENKLIQLFIDNVSVAQQLITVKKNSTNRYEFVTAVTSTGNYACQVKLENDHRERDNYYYFKISIPEQLKVASILLDNESIYMSHLFESINFKNSIITNTNYSANNIQRAINDGNDVIVQHGYHLLSTTGVELLGYVGNGGHLIIFPDDRDTSASELDIFESKYLDANQKGFSGDNYQIASVAKSDLHPNLFSEKYIEKPIKLFEFFKLPQNKNSILITNDGYSVYSRHYEGNGIIDIFSISPTLTWSNFPIRGYFIPFFHQLFYNQFNKSNKLYSYMNDQWEISTQVKENHKNLTYNSPLTSGYSIDINNPYIDYQKIPGIHKVISSDDSVIEFIAMNPRVIESIDMNLNDIQLKQFFSQSTSVILIGDGGDVSEVIKTSRLGSELWRLILYLITLLLIIEMIISSNAVKKTSG